MSVSTAISLGGPLALILILATGPVHAETAAESSPQRVELLSQACEIELALSAAPEHLRPDATVYALGERGYSKVREGTNGFTCLVNRDHPRVLKPTCFDREGTETIVPKILFFGRSLVAGTQVEEIRSEIEARFADGRYRSPGPGLAYMLSRYNRPYNPAADKLGWFPPHLMFYAPDLQGEDIGFQMEAWHADQSLPFIGYQGPHGYMIVITDDGQERSRSDLPSCPDWVHAG